METTTIKVHKSTKSILDSLRQKNESYDDIITTVISKLKNKDLKKELIEAYKSIGKEDMKILSEWEAASKEID